MKKQEEHPPARPGTWAQDLFAAGQKSAVAPAAGDAPPTRRDRMGPGALWAQALFQGKQPAAAAAARMRVIRNGIPIQEFDLAALKPETVIGRHPKADIQLEAQRLGMFHACLWNLDGECYIENLDSKNGALLNGQRLKLKHPVLLKDGAVVELPGYALQFTLPDWPDAQAVDAGQEAVEAIPDFSYAPPTETPPPCPLLSHLVEARENLQLWKEGVTHLQVADIIEESHDVKTFRFVGEQPLLFSYRPGQFVTFILDIDDREVRRSYSMSSSPSRPHTLDVTVKRIPGGLVSNWLCDAVRLGDVLKIQGPSGKFTCFDYPSDKLLFIAAGSGLTPVMSMARWIVDTAANVDVKLLASFRSPPDILFRRELEWMSARHSGLRVALTVTSGWSGGECWTGFTGRINRQMITLLAPDLQDRHVFVCGPEPFMAGLRDILRELDFDLAKLHSESFGTGRVARGVAPGAPTLPLSGDQHQVRFTRSGLTVEADEQTSLLELAEAHGIEIDYSCRSGSCGECQVRCQGNVAISRTCEIDAEQRAKGWVYACTTTARGDLEVEA